MSWLFSTLQEQSLPLDISRATFPLPSFDYDQELVPPLPEKLEVVFSNKSPEELHCFCPFKKHSLQSNYINMAKEISGTHPKYTSDSLDIISMKTWVPQPTTSQGLLRSWTQMLVFRGSCQATLD